VRSRCNDTIPDILRDVNTGPSQGRFRRLPDPRLQPQAGRLSGGSSGRILQADHGRYVAIGVRTDQELLQKINASLAKLKANGAVDKILDKWGLKAKSRLTRDRAKRPSALRPESSRSNGLGAA